MWTFYGICADCEQSPGYYVAESVKDDYAHDFAHTVHVKLSRGRHKLGLGVMGGQVGPRSVSGPALSAAFISFP